MKWFKHDSDASSDAKVKKLIMKYGTDGYAIYFHCLELIVGNISESNITFELEHDAEIIADTLKVEGKSNLSPVDYVGEIMRFIIALGLFEEHENHVTCYKIMKRIDASMSSNAKIRSLISKAKESHDRVMINHDEVMETHARLDYTTLDYTTLDKTTLEETQEPPIGDASASATQAIAPLPTKKKKRHKDADWYSDEINIERLTYITNFFKDNTDYAVTKETRHYLKDIVDNFTDHDNNKFMGDDFLTAYDKYEKTKDKYWSQGKRNFVGFYKSIGMV